MNTTQRQLTAPRRGGPGKSVLLPLAACLVASVVQAELPAPDNLLYGTITIGSLPITEADTNIVVEARRTVNGPAIATYRMGSDPGMGGFYRLKIQIEELTPVAETNESALVGDALVLVVRNATGVQVQLPYLIPERGHAQRLDFGTTVRDSDNDDLPDAWELAVFGNLGQNGNGDPDGDGHNNKNEFIAGTNPNDGNGFFHLTISRPGPVNRLVSFFAVTAAGAGYEGYDRIYTLESSTNLALSTWQGVPNYTNLLGNNSTVAYVSSEPDAQTFYRCRLQLRNK